MKSQVVAGVIFALLFAGAFQRTLARNDFDATRDSVGLHGFNKFVTPDNQVVEAAGWPVPLPALRPNALALSPDRKILAIAGADHQLTIVALETGQVWQHVSLPSDRATEAAPVAANILHADQHSQLSLTGLIFSPDGRRIYLSNVNGDIKVFSVDKSGWVTPLRSLPLPPFDSPARHYDIPAGLTVSPDGKKLYVVLNLSNRVAELDAATGKILAIWDTGVAPFDVVLAGRKMYVSNWGGRRPVTGSLTGPAGLGQVVRVDDRSIASEGSVSVIDLDDTNQAEIVTGLHTGALIRSPDGKYIVAANAGSDTLSVIDTRTDAIAETICARQDPGDAFGAQPDALAFDSSGERLYACNGTQNAVAVFQFDPGKSKLLGLIPAGWFPGTIAFDPDRKQIYVADLKGIHAGSPPFSVFNYHNVLSLIAIPSSRQLAHYTATALADLRYPLLARAKLPPRAGQPPQPVPERVGEPSVFQHVIYIIKENRTYDQILGDVKTGNGDATFCDFGERVTPNEHKLVREFTLLDNTYCSGMISADGHQWADSAIANDYVEREFSANWPRSYGGNDALIYASSGFIWDDALAHGKSFRDYGEFADPVVGWKDATRSPGPGFTDFYDDFTNGAGRIAWRCVPELESLRPWLDTNTLGWDLQVPDVFRAAQFKKELQGFEQAGKFPNLAIIYLPNDHTSGTAFGSPTPEAQVADNDLALGQVVEAVSHSIFWSNTCIFAVEDDSQAGWDHVSGFRTTAYVISPYTKRHATVSTQYNQTSLLRTMELILGLPPMNQMDATATPMFDCFTRTPDFTAYNAVPNRVPLDEMNPPPKKIRDRQLRRDANISARLPLKKEDQCPEDLFNHILWRATMGTQKPYPEWAVKTVDDD